MERVTIGDATLICADVIEGLQSLPDESVQCVVASPPYWGLRDYGVSGMIGLEPVLDCSMNPEILMEPKSGMPYIKKCGKCYMCKLVKVFLEVKRVLRSDGTVWLNMGDAYAASRSYQVTDNIHCSVGNDKSSSIPDGFKPKDLLMMPARLAIALQENGWWLRSEIIWAKPNPMPESVTDRPTSAHEKIYLLTKSAKYYYDADAVREKSTCALPTDPNYRACGKSDSRAERKGMKPGFDDGDGFYHPDSRNLRNVWTIATQPYPEAHFATFPEALPRKCIMAGTSEHGCCAGCGRPLERITEKSRTFESGSGRSGNMPSGKHGQDLQGGGETLDIRRGPCVSTKTTGWQASCECNAGTEPCTVLDPFSGSATTGLVALKLNRKYIGIELNPEYIELSIKRIKKEASQTKLFTGVDIR